MHTNKKSIGCLFPILLFALSACSQTKSIWVKAEGYFMIPVPGTVPVDDNGQPLNSKRDTVFYLFVETRNSNVQWEKAWRGSRSFSFASTATTASKTVVGEAQKDNRTIELSSRKGNVLWRLELADDTQRTRSPQAIKRDAFLLKGSFNKKSFYITLSSLIELASPLYQ